MTTESKYVRNTWYMAGWCKDFPAEGLRAVTLLDEPLVFYRQSDGGLVALEDRCCHRLAPLSHGRIEGNDIRCLYHGLKFASDGVCNEMPGNKGIPKAMKVRAYPVVERYSAAFIWMGDPAKADETLIPPFVGVDDPNWYMAPGRMDYDANYTLIQDNLLDLSHLTWVHRNSFGGGDEETNRAWSDGELRVSRIPHGVRVERWMRNAKTPPHQLDKAGPYCDFLTTFDYLVPGYFLLTSANYTPGAAERAGTDRPTEEPLYSSFTAQAVTPLTQKSTCYFFSFGPWNRVDGDPDVHRKLYADLAVKVFTEDREMLTAQQRIIDADPSRRMIYFEVDKAPVMFRRLVDKLLTEEASVATASSLNTA